jgi:hypothetical protein
VRSRRALISTSPPPGDLHIALDANTNSIAVIMKHIAGNLLSRWTDFLAADGEKPWRNRDDELVDSFGSRGELIDYWNAGWQRLLGEPGTTGKEGRVDLRPRSRVSTQEGWQVGV